MKNIWRLEELGEVGEILEASRPALAADWLAQHPNWQDPDISFLTTKKAIQLIMHDKMNKWAQYHNDTLHSYKMMDYIDPFIPSFIKKAKWSKYDQIREFFSMHLAHRKPIAMDLRQRDKTFDMNEREKFRIFGQSIDNGDIKLEHEYSDAWMLSPILYQKKYQKFDRLYKVNRATEIDGIQYADSTLSHVAKIFPTAVALTNKWEDVCNSSFYSILDRNNKIPIHTAPGNRDMGFLRIHVPVIIPPNKGVHELGFESEGERINWEHTWGFDNQSLHSAWNWTPHRRLVFIMDIHRDFLKLPKGAKRTFPNGSWRNFAIQYTRRAWRLSTRYGL